MRNIIVFFLIISFLSVSLLMANPLMGEETTQSTPDPMMVLLVGILLPGGGWLLLGDTGQFVKDLLITLVLDICLIGWIYGFWSAYKAYQEAQRRVEATSTTK